jgi:hypothetical protein
VNPSRCSAVGMAEDFLHSSLITSAARGELNKDCSRFTTEDSNLNRPRRFTVRHSRTNAPRKRGNQGDALLHDFDVLVASDPRQVIRLWLSRVHRRISRICSKSKHALLRLPHVCLSPLLTDRSISRTITVTVTVTTIMTAIMTTR